MMMIPSTTRRIGPAAAALDGGSLFVIGYMAGEAVAGGDGFQFGCYGGRRWGFEGGGGEAAGGGAAGDGFVDDWLLVVHDQWVNY